MVGVKDPKGITKNITASSIPMGLPIRSLKMNISFRAIAIPPNVAKVIVTRIMIMRFGKLTSLWLKNINNKRPSPKHNKN
jgi:hypothetical protein